MILFHLCNCQNVQLCFFSRQTQSSIIAEIVVFEFVDKSSNHEVVFTVCPWIAKSKKMFRLRCKCMFESQEKAFLAFCHTVLLYRLSDSTPFLLVFDTKDRQMSFFEKFDLIAHILKDKSNSRSLRNFVNREVEPGAIGRKRIPLNPQIVLNLYENILFGCLCAELCPDFLIQTSS